MFVSVAMVNTGHTGIVVGSVMFNKEQVIAGSSIDM
jgi:hypothetical protein